MIIEYFEIALIVAHEIDLSTWDDLCILIDCLYQNSEL